jgi:hypothetical protein
MSQPLDVDLPLALRRPEKPHAEVCAADHHRQQQYQPQQGPKHSGAQSDACDQDRRKTESNAADEQLVCRADVNWRRRGGQRRQAPAAGSGSCCNPAIENEDHAGKPGEQRDDLEDQPLAGIRDTTAGQECDRDQRGARGKREPAHPTGRRRRRWLAAAACL